MNISEIFDSRKVVRHSFRLTNRAKMIGGGRPLLPEILDQSDRVGTKSPIFNLFARGDSTVIPSEKTSINTNRKFTTRFPMSPR